MAVSRKIQAEIELAKQWQPGHRVPEILYCPELTGLGGFPQVVEQSAWIDLMVAESRQRGLREVFIVLSRKAAELNGMRIEVVDIGQQAVQMMDDAIRNGEEAQFFQRIYENTKRAAARNQAGRF